MKVLHLPSTYLPDHVGGKEVFLRELIKHTPAVDHLVVLHHPSRKSYELDGVKVRVLPPLGYSNYRYSYFSRIYNDAGGFDKVLDEFQPDLVHFHDQSDGASITHLRTCIKKKVRTLVTYHSPGQSCLQRALTLGDKTPCDGKIILSRCASCQYQRKHLPVWLADILGTIKTPFDPTGVVNQRNKTDLFYRSWNEFYDAVDRIQVSARWLFDLLVTNGVSKEKIAHIDLGGRSALPPLQHKADPSKPLKLVFIGRCNAVKGIHVLVDAVLKLPLSAAVEVYFYGPGWNDSKYGRDMEARVSGDPRFKKPELLDPEHVVDVIGEMDVCVIPSLWPETGPITVFDAFAAGLPIIGTDYAGIRERVNHNVDGLLFPWGDSQTLASQFKYLCENRDQLEKLRAGVTAKRTFAEFAADMQSLYTKMIGPAAP
jgi:glycosyltransferase involved in cell wall biosynthesis